MMKFFSCKIPVQGFDCQYTAAVSTGGSHFERLIFPVELFKCHSHHENRARSCVHVKGTASAFKNGVPIEDRRDYFKHWFTSVEHIYYCSINNTNTTCWTTFGNTAECCSNQRLLTWWAAGPSLSARAGAICVFTEIKQRNNYVGPESQVQCRHKGISLSSRFSLEQAPAICPLSTPHLQPSGNVSNHISLTQPFPHWHTHTRWPVDVMELLHRFCCWTRIGMLRSFTIVTIYQCFIV